MEIKRAAEAAALAAAVSPAAEVAAEASAAGNRKKDGPGRELRTVFWIISCFILECDTV